MISNLNFFKMSSESSSKFPLVHTLASTETREGIQATIFFDQSDSFDGVNQDDLNSNSVYLTSIKKNEKSLPFHQTMTKSLCVPIFVYIDLLFFINYYWPSFENNMNEQFVEIRKLKVQSNNHSILTKIEGTCVFQKWFDTVFFQVTKKSHNFQSDVVYLQKENISIELDLNVLKMLAIHCFQIKNVIFDSGYIFPN